MKSLRNEKGSCYELNNLEPLSSSAHVHSGSKSASPSPIVGNAKSSLRRGPSSVGSPDWSATDEIQRLVALDQQRQSNSSLGINSW
ncbi:hypothetical protein Phum_PHUM597200 [Pediculus humanus corporis]|uniref:Uncharacterized protein n=1 Tax=Pediculus humanus subsp. corporis TaxID=121224 RepID=E0W2U7_PEDHC|nr:uncharacterized protein Phum_PHUM597200 [Pediculus humanus corporis]EEB19953.1 hypothetical protein Phum_PHUM597200 [Pediculus humanus corporis]